jgi:flagellar motility protein MotE (MotC chaperone)
MSAELTEAEAAGLNKIKSQMSKTQREEMAEIISKEMERRGMVGDQQSYTRAKQSGVKSAAINGGLSSEQVKELYQDVGQAMQQLKVKKLEEKLNQARGSATKKNSSIDNVTLGKRAGFATPSFSLPKVPSPQSFLFLSVCVLAAVKAAFILGIFDSSIATAKPITDADRESAPIQIARAQVEDTTQVSSQGARLWSLQEKDILTQLDSRRVELEKRKDALDKREQEVKNQAQALVERLAELRGLTSKLQELRKEREHKQEGRMAQLANVYGGMEPQEASNLLSRLEDPIALELLERMPEKRMGQVLSFMEKGRAVDLTKLLTEKKVVE